MPDSDSDSSAAAQPPLRLTIELVPATSWGANVRDMLPREAWDRLRRQVYAASQHHCAICGAAGRLHCHELWDYDDARHIQSLRGLVALCALCHAVKHIGHTRLLADQGQLDYERVVAHFLRVNSCDRATFERHRAAAFARFEQRSRYEWQLDV
ncbi:MAG: HNH endonuclease [Ktedonobacterales bacterium]